MKEVLEYEFKEFLLDMERGETFCKYFDEDWYEDDYSHNEISEYQMRLEEKIIEWLRVNKPGKYLVSGGYCIFVMTKEEAEKRHMWNIDDCLIGEKSD